MDDPLLPEVIRRHDRLVLVSHALCPYVQRAVIALTVKGVAFERVDIDLACKPEWFLRVSPLGKTPVLLVPRDGATVPVFESAVICDYLDETIEPALHPADALERARHRAWIEVASATLNQIWQLYTARDAASFERHRAGLVQRFAQVEAALGEGPWFAGRAFSLVDAAFAPVFRYFDVFDAFWQGRLFDHTPRVRAWRARLSRRAEVRLAVRAEYPGLLRAFVEQQGGVLGTLSVRERQQQHDTVA
jgi:glutathione S-transferase